MSDAESHPEYQEPHTDYFAYGSNLSLIQIARRCPGTEIICRATLAGHRLIFPITSEDWGGGVAGMEPAAGEHVERGRDVPPVTIELSEPTGIAVHVRGLAWLTGRGRNFSVHWASFGDTSHCLRWKRVLLISGVIAVGVSTFVTLNRKGGEDSRLVEYAKY